MDIRTEILQLVQKKESDLPTLPVIVNKIISVASDKKTTTQELSDVISYDQGMTTKLLKLANSIYYAQKIKVETIKRAITVIGFEEIIGIALGMGILSSFTKKSGLNIDMKALWIHGIGVATIAKELAKRTNPGSASKIFIPALLHDMGKVIFSVYFKDEYTRARQFALEKKKPLYFAENALFKIDHAVLSALMMKRWNFPQSIILPCRFHHHPESSPIKFRHHTLIINLADYLTQKAGIGYSGNPFPVAVKNSPKKIGISPSILKLTMDQLKQKEDEIKDFYTITTGA